MKKENIFYKLILLMVGGFFSFSTIASETYEGFKGRLIENVFTIQHAATLYPLSEPLQEEYSEKDEIKIKKNKFKDSFRFIEKDKKGLLIKGIENNRYLGSDGKDIFYKSSHSLDKNINLFLWDIIHLEKDTLRSPWIVKIQHRSSKRNLVINNNQSDKTTQVIMLCEESEKSEKMLCEESEKSEEMMFSVPQPFKWYLHPFYPEAGYSNFFNIIYDFGELIALKHECELISIKTKPSFPHDFCNLSVVCLGKSNVFLAPHIEGYRSSIREIFSTEDYFTSNDLNAEGGSTLKLTRVIETEEVFQTTIENSLVTTNRAIKTKEDKISERSDNTRIKGMEKIDQTSFDEKLSTQVNVSIAQTEERSIERNQSKRKSEEQSQSQSINEGSQSTHNVSANAELGFKPLGVGVGGGYSYSHGANSGKSDTASSSSQSERSTGKATRTNSVSANTKDTNTGSERGSQSLINQKDSATQQETRELGKESSSMETVELEHTLNLTEVTSVIKKRNEKWFIDREFIQKPNTALFVKFFEQDIEAVDVPFCSHLRVFGYIGFRFNKIVRSIKPRFSKDYFDSNENIWFISPATIIHYLPAPGYTINSDGSVDYLIKGKVNLKHPLNIITMINQVDRSGGQG